MREGIDLGAPPTVWQEIRELRRDVDTLGRRVDRWAGIFVGVSVAVQVIQMAHNLGLWK